MNFHQGFGLGFLLGASFLLFLDYIKTEKVGGVKNVS